MFCAQSPSDKYSCSALHCRGCLGLSSVSILSNAKKVVLSLCLTPEHKLANIPCRLCKARLGSSNRKQLKAAGYKDKRVLSSEDLSKALADVRCVTQHQFLCTIFVASKLLFACQNVVLVGKEWQQLWRLLSHVFWQLLDKYPICQARR
jgi:hypothetical protein